MRKYFLIFGLGLACLLTSSVFANGSRAYIPQRPASYAIPGWVIGADAGWGYLETPKDNLAFSDELTGYLDNLSQSHDIGSTVWGVHGGRTFGITPNMLLGFEVGYKDLGKSKYDSTGKILWIGLDHFNLSRKVDQQNIDMLLTGNYFVWRGLNISMKAGMAYVESTTRQIFNAAETTGIPPDALNYYNTKKSIWRLRPEVMLGVGYMFNNFDFHILYDHIFGVSETKWGELGSDYWWGWSLPYPAKPRTYGENLVVGGISYTFADSNLHTLQPISVVEPGWIIGADAGWGYLDAPEDNLAFCDDGVSTNFLKNLSQSHDIGDVVWEVHGGRTFGITPNMLLGFEVGYKDLGKSKYKSSGKWYIRDSWQDFDLSRKVDQQAIDILLTGNYFIWHGLNLFAKAGMAYVGSTTRQTFNPTTLSVYELNTKKSIWELRPEVILGMGYMFNHIDVHILYDYIYGVSETKWADLGSDYWWGYFPPFPAKPRAYGANLIMGGVSFTF